MENTILDDFNLDDFLNSVDNYTANSALYLDYIENEDKYWSRLILVDIENLGHACIDELRHLAYYDSIIFTVHTQTQYNSLLPHFKDSGMYLHLVNINYTQVADIAMYKFASDISHKFPNTEIIFLSRDSCFTVFQKIFGGNIKVYTNSNQILAHKTCNKKYLIRIFDYAKFLSNQEQTILKPYTETDALKVLKYLPSSTIFPSSFTSNIINTKYSDCVHAIYNEIFKLKNISDIQTSCKIINTGIKNFEKIFNTKRTDFTYFQELFKTLIEEKEKEKKNILSFEHKISNYEINLDYLRNDIETLLCDFYTINNELNNLKTENSLLEKELADLRSFKEQIAHISTATFIH